MCGIAGILTKSQTRAEEYSVNANRVQIHRGPDEQSIFLKSTRNWNIGFAHQRLSIIDLKSGSQPFQKYKDKAILIYNGEIFNYLELKKELKSSFDISFITQSDTEVIYEAIFRFGIEEAIRKFNGMWAFAYYDIENEKIFLCRDRFGIKPLYYCEENGEFSFASEVKTILNGSSQKFKLNSNKIFQHFSKKTAYQNGATYFENISAIPAGNYLTLHLEENYRIKKKIKEYWKLDCRQTSSLDFDEAEYQLKRLVTDSINLSLRSDVPVASLLSGGVDSSIIGSILADNTNSPTCFSFVPSDHSQEDESPFIQSVVNKFNFNNHEILYPMDDLSVLDNLEKICWFNDSPVFSLSSVAYYFLSEQVNKMKFKVILSGQGADELFLGYKKYFYYYFYELMKNGQFIKMTNIFSQFLLNNTVLSETKFSDIKRYLAKNSLKDYDFLIFSNKKNTALFNFDSDDDFKSKQFNDIFNLSVPNWLHYEDRMSMAHSVEVRLPFLDYRLAEFAFSLPVDFFIKQGWTKYILRKSFESKVPPQNIWRKNKIGFEINPRNLILKHKEKIINYFNESYLQDFEIIDLKLLKSFLSKKINPQASKDDFSVIFSALSLEAFLKAFKNNLNY